MEKAFPLDGIVRDSEQKLTCVDEELVGDPGVIHVVDCSCENGSEDFQIREDSLGWSNRNCQGGVTSQHLGETD